MTDKTEEFLMAEMAAAFGLEPGKIRLENLIISDLGAESLDLVDLTFRLEKRFGIRIPEGELFEIKAPALQKLTVRDVADYVRKAQAGQPV